jgi:hypothetical protein
MSQVKISGNASGTGVLTIAAPNTNTDRTINIPDTAGDIVTTGDSGTITAPMLDGGQSGSAPAFAVRAWVYFNGSGTVAINGSGNVSSITDNGTGLYTVNFTTDLPSNYGVASFSGRNAYSSVAGDGNTRSTSSIDIAAGYNDSATMTFFDNSAICVIFCG